jgi:RND family efflux transporter MFP subunit
VLWIAALVLLLAPAGYAHEEDQGGVAVVPEFRELAASGKRYRLGLAVVPKAPVAGETVRFEIQAVELLRTPEPLLGPALPLSKREVKLRFQSGERQELAAKQGAEAGLYLAERRFNTAGHYRATIEIKLNDGGEVLSSEFVVPVSAGPAGSVRWGATTLLVLLLGAWAGSRARRRSEKGNGDSATEHLERRRLLALAAGGGTLVVLFHLVVAPRLGAYFLPEREAVSVNWTPAESPELSLADSGAGLPLPFRHHTGAKDLEISGKVVAKPGNMAQVLVPMTAAVRFEKGSRVSVGAQVRAGQTLAILEPRYVLHDTNHLINQRWLALTQELAAKRNFIQAEAEAERARYGYENRAVALQQVQMAEAAAAVARQQHERAQKALEVLDQQIRQEELSPAPIKSPISGSIIAAQFTQGQTVYEGDPLLRILDLSTVWVEAAVPESMLRDVMRSRRTVWFASPAYPGKGFEGKLVNSGTKVDAETRTVPVFFEVENRKNVLRLGMLLSARPGEAGWEASQARPTGLGGDALGSRRVVQATGVLSAKPELVAEVTAPLWGRIEFAKRRLAPGERVSQGEPLARVVLELSAEERYTMNERYFDIQSEEEQAKQRAEQAELMFRRAVELLKADTRNQARKKEVEISERIFRSAREEQELIARQKRAFENVMKIRDPKITTVTAPISGSITEVHFTPGELDRTQEFRRLFTVTDTSKLWLEAHVFESDIEAAVSGHKAYFSTVADPEKRRPLGKPVAVAGELEPGKHTLKVIYEVPNPAGELKLGMFATVWLESK